MMPTSASRNGGAVASTSRTPRPIDAPGQRSAPESAYSAANASAMQERDHDELDGGGQIGGDVGRHGLPGAQRATEVAGEQAADEPRELFQHRVVQPQPLPLGGDHLR